MNLGLKLEEVREEVLNLLGAGVEGETRAAKAASRAAAAGDRVPAAARARARPRARQFGRDLTELAKEGELDPVIGRTNEIERVIRCSAGARRTTPCCWARRAWARRRSSRASRSGSSARRCPRSSTTGARRARPGDDGRGHEVPRPVRGAHQGGHERGPPAKNVILFIDELHTLVGAGGAEGAIDASNVLKPALAAARSSASARRRSTSTASTSRRTRAGPPLPVDPVDPPNAEQTVEILKGLRDKYEEHHRVQITDEALERRSSCRPLHHRPRAAGQVDRRDRRGGRPRADQEHDQAAGPGGDRGARSSG
jgi:ATP-dependent Clp protease ATP-binding subunit ClpC